MKKTVYFCDLCAEEIEKEVDPGIKIKWRPVGGWTYENVVEFMDLCVNCVGTIMGALNDIRTNAQGNKKE